MPEIANMGGNNRVQKPKDELKAELKSQLEILSNLCTLFDMDKEVMGKPIANSLRLLLHNGNRKFSNKSLLDQLGLRNRLFCDTSSEEINKYDRAPKCTLLALSHNQRKWISKINAHNLNYKLTRFDKWWNNAVIQDSYGHRFCRRELILYIADTDGGAHVDSDIDTAYLAISRLDSMGYFYQKDEQNIFYTGNVPLICMRQIAHELLETMSKYEDYKNFTLVPMPEKISTGLEPKESLFIQINNLRVNS